MHEASIVGAMVRRLNEEIKGKGVPRVIKLHTTSAFPEQMVRRLFALYATDTPLEKVPLEISVELLRHVCACGQESVIWKDDLVGHFFFCPSCRAPVEVAEAHQLECLDVLFGMDGMKRSA